MITIKPRKGSWRFPIKESSTSMGRVSLFLMSEVKRMIDFEKLKGFTLNDYPHNFEFVFHVVGESDYRFKTDMKEERKLISDLVKT